MNDPPAGAPVPPVPNVLVRLNSRGPASVQVTGATVGQALDRLDRVAAGLRARGVRVAVEPPEDGLNVASNDNDGGSDG